MENRTYEERHNDALEIFDGFMGGTVAEPVSYTHLTLPTICSV